MKEKKDKLWPKNGSNKNGFITELAAHWVNIYTLGKSVISSLKSILNLV